jgi:S-adenosylmethionine:tRNA ribosyltransferase-isomerase
MDELSAEALDYPFDVRHVATTPAHPRDAARLMVVDRAAGTVEHAHVRDLARWVGAGDALVVNRSSVLRARLRTDTTEGLLLEPMPDGTWRMLLRRAKRFAAGDRLPLVGPHGPAEGDAIELVARAAEAWRVLLRDLGDVKMRMYAAEDAARDAGAGLWSACAGEVQ